MTSYASETRLSEAVLARVRDVYRGCARKVHGSAYTGRGEPDIDACLPTVFGIGRAVKIELKQPGQVPTAAQYGAMRRWAAAGALVGWVTSTDELDALLAHVDDVGWVNPQLERRPVERIDLTA